MAISSNSGGEYLDVKIFLYKYTPQFTLVDDTSALQQATTDLGRVETVEGTWQVTKYSIDLNAPKYFSKFDLTQYIRGYQFKQGLSGSNYDWTVSFQDAIIPFGQLAPNSTANVRKTVTFLNAQGVVQGNPVVAGPPCRSSSSVELGTHDLVDLMAQYEAECNWPSQLATEVNTITSAYLSRGTVTTPYASNSQGDANSILNAPGSDIKFNNPQLNGLRLSDLVQKYNYMSVFVYKSSISPTQAVQAAFPGKHVPGISGATGNQIFNSSNEVHLMLAGYKNEFNGFVTGKTFSRNPGQVDQVSVTGHGSLRLFSDTKVLYDPSFLVGGFYDASILNATAPSTKLNVASEAVSQYFSTFQNLFQGKDPIEILRSLLFLVYKISFNLVTPIPNTAVFNSTLKEYHGFYDIYQLVFNQTNSTTSALDPSASTQINKAGNLITIAPFLLSLVMALRNYNYNLRHNLQISDSLQSGGTNGLSKDLVNQIPDNSFSQIDPVQPTANNFAEEFGGPCVQISAVDKTFQPYFTMLRSGFDNYLSGLKSGHEIMSEVTLFSLLEFYEKPNGRIILRTPQYNQPARVTTSGELDPTGNALSSKVIRVIQASYGEDGTQIQTQKRGSWYVSLTGQVEPFHPSYGNGKLMMQYGFREAIAEANPVLEGLAQKIAAGAVNSTVPTAPTNFNSFISTNTTTSLSKTNLNLTLAPSSTADINNLVHKYLRFLLEFDNAGLRIGSLSLEGDPGLEVGKLFFDYTNNKMGYIVDVSKQLTVGGTYTCSITLKFVRDILNDGTEFRQIPTLEELVSATTGIIAGASSTPVVEFPSVPQPRATGTNQAQIFSNLKSGLSANPFPSA